MKDEKEWPYHNVIVIGGVLGLLAVLVLLAVAIKTWC